MSFLRRSTQSIITNIRQITVKNIAQTQRENAAKAVTVGAGQQMLNQVNIWERWLDGAAHVMKSLFNL